MNIVIEHLEYLIRRHDCVVVPGLGAFISRSIPAEYDSTVGLYSPPRRELAFNSSVIYDDRLLASSVARKERISVDRAIGLISTEAESMKKQLAADGEIVIGRLGRLRMQSTSMPFFEPNNHSASWLSMGLSPISVKPVETGRSSEEDYGMARYSKPTSFSVLKKITKVAAAVAMLLMVGIATVFPLIDDRHDNMAAVSATLNNFVSSSQTDLYPAINTDKILMIAVPGKTDLSSESFQPEQSAVGHLGSCVNNDSQEVLLRNNESDRYCLIVASLPTEQMAHQFIEENPGINLEILSQNGRYRVYAATGETTEQALDQKRLSVISKRFPDAWVCRR